MALERKVAAWLAGVLLLVMTAGCARSSRQTPVAPGFTVVATGWPIESETRPPMVVVLPDMVIAGDELVVSVKNVGAATYALAIASPGNCLLILDGDGERVVTHPDLTCDALELRTVQPGQTDRYGTWDLTICVDAACTERAPAAPGIYTLRAELFRVGEDGELVAGSAFTIEEAFTVAAGSG